MLLLELNGHYFWIASNELHGEAAPPEIAAKVRALAWRIADKLREADDVQHLEQILTVLMNEDAYKTANDRANALDAVINAIGDTVNPRYAKLIRSISKTTCSALPHARPATGTTHRVCWRSTRRDGPRSESPERELDGERPEFRRYPESRPMVVVPGRAAQADRSSLGLLHGGWLPRSVQRRFFGPVETHHRVDRTTWSR